MRSKFLSLLMAMGIFVPALLIPFQSARGATTNRVHEAIEVVKQLVAIPESAIPPALLNDAYGIAIIPGVIKAGFVLGGRYGKGVMAVRHETGWSNPVFVSLTGGSIGLQIGVQSADIILVFKTRRSIDGIVSGKFTLGGDASIAAGPVGRHAEASTDEQLKAEIYSYSRSRGLFAGLAVGGAALQIDHNANRDFYNSPGLLPTQIFSDLGVTAPQAAIQLRQELNRYTSVAVR